jgi:Uncharacterized conserved protein
MSQINIHSYSSDWPSHFDRVKVDLLAIFFDRHVQIEHIGSTSVPGLAAKPIIDVLLGADSLPVIELKTPKLQARGYQYIARYETDLPMRRYFFKPEEPGLLRVNLHAVVLRSTFWLEHIAFRDALRSSASVLADYSSLKSELAARHPDDMPAYTAAKTPFIRSTLTSLEQKDGR